MQRLKDRKQILQQILCTRSVQSCCCYCLFELRNGAPFIPCVEFHARWLAHALHTLCYEVSSELSFILHTISMHLGTFLSKKKVPMCLCPTYLHSQDPHIFHYVHFTLSNIIICILYKTLYAFLHKGYLSRW